MSMRDDLLFLGTLFKYDDVSAYRLSYMIYKLKNAKGDNKVFDKYLATIHDKYDFSKIFDTKPPYDLAHMDTLMTKLEHTLDAKEYPIFKKKFSKYLLLSKL